MLTVKLKKIAEMKRLGLGWQEIKKQEKTKLNKNAKKNGSTERETQTRDGGREEETRGN